MEADKRLTAKMQEKYHKNQVLLLLQQIHFAKSSIRYCIKRGTAIPSVSEVRDQKGILQDFWLAWRHSVKTSTKKFLKKMSLNKLLLRQKILHVLSCDF